MSASWPSFHSQKKKKEKAKAEMQKMLDYVEKLDELDTSEVEPMSHIFQDEKRIS